MKLDISKIKTLAMGAAKIFEPINRKVGEHSPEILMAAGVVGFVATCISVAKASPKAKEAYEECQGMPTFDMLVEVAPHYIPSAALGALTLTCFFGSNRILDSRRAAAVAAYSLTERVLTKYEEKVIDRLGEEGAVDISKEVSDEIAREDCVDDKIVTVNGAVPIGPGEKLYKDCVTGRFFAARPETVANAEAAINRRLPSEVTISLDEFYAELGIEDESVVSLALGFEAGRCPLDISKTVVHRGTPIEYTYLHYHFVVVNKAYLEGPRGRAIR